ncbi:hypothetical protein Lal_00016834 [Lupinus albus]|nr:hypothetical protein Lal_00016834 [Lupinus albus]
MFCLYDHNLEITFVTYVREENSWKRRIGTKMGQIGLRVPKVHISSIALSTGAELSAVALSMEAMPIMEEAKRMVCCE